MNRDAIDSGAKPGVTSNERKELVEARRLIDPSRGCPVAVL